MQIKILSLLGSIIITSFILGFLIWATTSHIEVMAISGTIIMLWYFYSIIKEYLESKGE